METSMAFKILSSQILIQLLLWSNITANADDSTCIEDTTELYQNEDLVNAFTGLALGFTESCIDDETCPYEIDDELMAWAFTTATDVQGTQGSTPDITSLSPPPAIIVEGKALAADLKSESSYVESKEACDALKAKFQCVDVKLDFEGVIPQADSLEIDILLEGFTIPICLPSSCDGEDLAEVTENAVIAAIKENDDVKDVLSESGIPVNTLDIISIEFICLAIGLETCVFTVEPVPCAGGVVIPEKPMTSEPSGISSSASELHIFGTVGLLCFFSLSLSSYFS